MEMTDEMIIQKAAEIGNSLGKINCEIEGLKLKKEALLSNLEQLKLGQKNRDLNDI